MGKEGLPSLPTGQYSFPSDLIDPKIKEGKDYCLKYIKAGYARYKENMYFINFQRRSDWVTNRQYAVGNQTVQKYLNWVSKLKNAQNQTVSYLDLDWSIVSTIPKIRDKVLSYLLKIDYDIFADAINPEAQQDREQAKVRMQAEKELEPFLKEMAAVTGLPLDKGLEAIPETANELELWMQYAFRLNYEISMELGIQAVYNENDWKEVRKLMFEDAFDLGCMASETYIDRISGRIRVKYIDPINMVLEDFRGHDGTVMPRIGYVEKMTIAELKLEAGDQFTEEEYHKMAEQFKGWWTNPEQLSPYADYINTDITQWYRQYDNWQILVMKYQWDTCDRYKFTKRTINEAEFVFPEKFDTKLSKKSSVDENGNLVSKEVYATDIKTIYQGKWIIGTDYIYDYGKAVNIPRPQENMKECHKSIHFYRVSTKSMIDRIIPYADSIQLAWLKIQNAKARSYPRGMLLEIGAFDNVFIDSKLVTAEQVLQTGMQTGVWTYRRNSTMDDDGYDQAGRPMEETEGGMGTFYQEMLQSIASDIASINEVIGTNAFTDATTPSSEALVGIANIAVQNTQDALNPLLAGFISIHEQVSLSICLLMQLLVRHDKFSGYTSAIGNMPRQYIEVGNEVAGVYGSLVAYGIRIQARATTEQKQQLLRYAELALSNSQDPSKGGIELPDLIELSRMLENGTNLKLVANILGQRIKNYKVQMQQMAQQNMQVQSDQIIQQTQAAAQSKQQELQMQLEYDKQLDSWQTDNKIRLLQVEYSLRGQDNFSKQSAKTQGDLIKESAKQETEVVKGEMKKELEREKPKKPASS